MKKGILTIVILVILGIAGAVYFTSQNNTSSSSTLTAQSPNQNNTTAQYILSLLQKMKNVDLKDTIFKDPEFINLKDNSVTFTTQEAGRNNPFSPIGNDDALAQASSTR